VKAKSSVLIAVVVSLPVVTWDRGHRAPPRSWV